MRNRYVDDTIQFLFHCVLVCLFLKQMAAIFSPFFPVACYHLSNML